MSRFFAFCAFALFSSIGWAQGLVVSTQPIYLIAKEVTKGVEQPALLLQHQSGHDVSLTPMHRKMVQDADLVVWLGKAHEAPLEKLLAGNPKSIAVLDSGIVSVLPLRNPRGQALPNTVDTHVWLEPNNAVRIGFFIAALRSQQMPAQRERYWANARAFAHSLLLTAQKLNVSAKAQPYWSYHDAYQYLERPLNLKFAGALTDDGQWLDEEYIADILDLACISVGEQPVAIDAARFTPHLDARRAELEKEVQGRNSRYYDQQEELLYRNQQDRKAEHEGAIRDYRAKEKEARKLARQGWRLADVVEARDLPEAERRYFERALSGVAAPPRREVAAPPRAPSAAPVPIIGLFPEASGR